MSNVNLTHLFHHALKLYRGIEIPSTVQHEVLYYGESVCRQLDIKWSSGLIYTGLGSVGTKRPQNSGRCTLLGNETTSGRAVSAPEQK